MKRCTVVLMLSVLVVAPVRAQDRMPPISPSTMTDAQKAAAAEFRQARGSDISGPFVPLLRSPEVMTRARAMGDYLRFKSVLSPRLSEFVILMTSRAWTQHYEWHAHHPLALKAGLNPETARAIAEGSPSSVNRGSSTRPESSATTRCLPW
jgi:4-carboxymuconolactone decarboxylase